jgi:hypothetical protein
MESQDRKSKIVLRRSRNSELPDPRRLIGEVWLDTTRGELMEMIEVDGEIKSKRCRILTNADVEQLRSTLAILNSLIESAEPHSEATKHAYQKTMKILEEPPCVTTT